MLILKARMGKERQRDGMGIHHGMFVFVEPEN